MSVSNAVSSTFLDFCIKVRNNDPSILPESGEPFKIRYMREREGKELADALLENISVTYIEIDMNKYTRSAAEAMAKYVRNSKRLQRISWKGVFGGKLIPQDFQHREEMLCCFLPAIQDSVWLEELDMQLLSTGGPSNQALENMLTHTQSLRSLTLRVPPRHIGKADEAAVQSGLKKNTTLQELTFEFSSRAATVSPILATLHHHPLLRRICFRGHVKNLTGLETVLLSDTSKITELDIDGYYRGPPATGLTRVLEALVRHPTLTKLALRCCHLGHDEVRLLQMALCNMPSLRNVALTNFTFMGSTELAVLAPALYHNTSIKVLDLSGNNFNDMKSARLVRDIIHRNKTITTFDLSRNKFGRIAGAIECIADGLCINSTLRTIDLSLCVLGDGGVSILAQTLGSRNTTLQILTLANNSITSVGVCALLETMEQSSLPITDLDLANNSIGNEGASLIARFLGKNALPNLARLSLSRCDIGDDGFTTLVSALEQNTSLLHLDSGYRNGFSERAFVALAESLPKIKVLQQLKLSWCEGLGSVMPLLLAGLRKNTSLFRFNVTACAPHLFPPTPEEAARCAGGWMQEIEGLRYRNRCLTLIRAPKDTLPPLGVWPRALARVAIYPDYIFLVLCSKPGLVPSEDKGD
jgi:Ran GTPase-activating protein (RanGAP) involved in mRNA processing and transport